MPEGRRAGRFEIVGELGRGGMARVHLARQLNLDRYVALKELGSLQRDDAEMVERFLRESRLAGALNHPNIVTVLEFFEDDGVQYIAMEYVERGSLRPWIGRLAPAQFGGVMEGMLAGLAHAHAAGVVHRDLKPENLMLTADGRIKIADFGIAKALAQEGTTAFRTATGVAIGTPQYMAPEQAMAQEVGAWTDLYASGVIAYELLSGTLPFTAGEPMAILLAHCTQTPPPLVERAPEAAPAIVGWVERLMAKEPSGRPRSARAAWEELEEHLIDALGARWRRDARIEGEPAAPVALTTPRPITPAQFPSDPQPAPAESDEWGPPGEPEREPEPSPEPPGRAPAPAFRPARRGPVVSAVAAVAAVAVTAALALGGGDDEPSAPAAPAERVVVAGAPSEAAPLGDDWIRAIHVWTYAPEGFSGRPFERALRIAKADGASHVVLHPYLEPVSNRAPVLRDKPDAPSSASFGTAVAAVARAGMKAIIEPTIEPPDSYAGEYAPDDPAAFFESYRERLLDLAGHEPDLLVVGTMLSLLDDDEHTGRWEELIAAARERCGCRISYVAEDLDGAGDVRFWSSVDLIGVDLHGPLTDEPVTDPAALTDAWGERRTALQRLAERHDKPVWLAELGYRSRSDASAANSYAAQGEPSEDAQAAMYEAAFRTFAGEPWFSGIGWFELSGDGERATRGDYRFDGKLAERVMRGWHTAR